MANNIIMTVAGVLLSGLGGFLCFGAGVDAKNADEAPLTKVAKAKADAGKILVSGFALIFLGALVLRFA